MNENSKRVNQVSLTAVFENHFFKIPDYQRGYSWGNKQRVDLIGDIEDTLLLVSTEGYDHYQHYMGTVVAYPVDGPTILDVVDGQQRLTSLVLLISSIVNQSTLVADDIKQQLKQQFLITEDERHRFVSGQQKEILQKIIDGLSVDCANVTLQQDLNICEAKRFFDSVVEAWDKKDVTATILNVITERLGFLLFVPEHESVVGRMFEVINNRGKQLSELEKLKNYFIYISEQLGRSELKELVNENWKTVLQNIQFAGFQSSHEEDEFLKVCWLVYGNPSIKNNTVYSGFKSQIALCDTDFDRFKMAKGFFELIYAVSDTYRHLFTCKEVRGQTFSKLDKEIEKLRSHPSHLAILPLYVSIMHSKTFKVEDAQKISLISLLEKLNFRYYVSGLARRSNQFHSDLFRLAFCFFNGANSDQVTSYNHPITDATKKINQGNFSHVESVDELESKLEIFISTNARMSQFLGKLKLEQGDSYNYYDWLGMKYFLASYEIFQLSKKKDLKFQSHLLSDYLLKRNNVKMGDSYQREHVWATQDRALEERILNDGVMTQKKKKGYQLRIAECKRRLGNFILLRPVENQSISNWSISKKVDYFNQTVKGDQNSRGLTQGAELVINVVKQVNSEYTNQSNAIANVLEYHEKIVEGFEQLYLEFAEMNWGIALDKEIDVEVEETVEDNALSKVHYFLHINYSFLTEAERLLMKRIIKDLPSSDESEIINLSLKNILMDWELPEKTVVVAGVPVGDVYQTLSSKIYKALSNLPDSTDITDINSSQFFKVDDASQALTATVIDKILADDLTRFVSGLDESNAQVLSHRLGFKAEVLTLAKLGDLLKLTKAGVNLIEERLFEELALSVSLGKNVISNGVLNSLRPNLVEDYPLLAELLGTDKNIVYFFEIVMGLKKKSLAKIVAPDMGFGIIFEWFTVNPAPLSLEKACFMLQDEYGCNEQIANNAILQADISGEFLIENDCVSPKKLTKPYAIAQACLHFEQGAHFKEIHSYANRQGFAKAAFPANRIEGSIPLAVDQGFVYLCANGSYKHLSFFGLSEERVNEVLKVAKLYLQQAKASGRDSSHVKELYDHVESVQQHDYFDIRHVLRQFGENVGIYFAGKSGADTISLDSEVSPVGQEQRIIDFVEASNKPVSKQDIAKIIRSGSLNHAAFYINELVEKGLLVRVDATQYDSPDKIYHKAPKDEIFAITARMLSFENKPIDIEVIMDVCNDELSLSHSKIWYLSLLRLESKLSACWFVLNNLVSNTENKVSTMEEIRKQLLETTSSDTIVSEVKKRIKIKEQTVLRALHMIGTNNKD